jgi:serine protease AprX
VIGRQYAKRFGPRRAKAFVVVALLAAGLPALTASSNSLTTVVISGEPGRIDKVVSAVQKAGGSVVERIDLIDGVIARLPASAMNKVEASSSVDTLSVDSAAVLTGVAPTDGAATLLEITETIGAADLQARGTDGWDIGVALIDSGVSPVKGLENVVQFDDVSPTRNNDKFRKLDQFGHGTHLAGIMSLNDYTKAQVGVSPGARVINVKVADQTGEVSLSSVLQALEHVVDQRNANGLNIRVINLSLGFDPASAGGVLVMRAAERAVQQGIVVVAAAGNKGTTSASLVSPAASPLVIAVGASDTRGTSDRSDDTVASFSSVATDGRYADVVAPGVGVVSSRDINSVLDVAFPGARRGKLYFRGSGSSQSAAVVSGAVALLLNENPTLTPSQVKTLLMSTATRIPGVPVNAQGSGQIDVQAAADALVPNDTPLPAPREINITTTATTTGLDPMTGDLDGTRWTGTRWTGTRWTGSEWV